MSALAVSLAFVLWVQNPAELFQKAPPAVDEALRARISKFFQAHVDGKFRAAMEVVAEDSKDAFFSANKPRCYSFEIVRIAYSEDFTHATATVTCEMDHPSPGLGGVKVNAPRTSLWKLEGGQWCYYIDPSQGYQTPFGLMKPGPGQATNIPPSIASGVSPEANADAARLLSWVKANKLEIRLSASQAGSDELTLTNRGAGTAQLIMQYAPMPGLEITLDRKTLKKGESARLAATWKPGEIPPPATIPVQILVEPTGQLVTVRTKFTREPAK